MGTWGKVLWDQESRVRGRPFVVYPRKRSLYMGLPDRWVTGVVTAPGLLPFVRLRRSKVRVFSPTPTSR